MPLYQTITGHVEFKGSTDCSANPNYPSALIGDRYYVSVAGKIGGASGIVVTAGDSYEAIADNAGGTQAAVGTSWAVYQGNIDLTAPGAIGGTTPAAGSFTTLSASGAASFADGTAAAPSIAFTSDADGAGTGWYRFDANRVIETFNGNATILSSVSEKRMSSALALNWASTTNPAAAGSDTTIRRLAAQSLVLGAANSATPLANTLTIGESSRGGTDSNVAGANGVWQPGLGTGTAKSGDAIVKTGNSTTTGTTAHAYSNRQYVAAKYVDLTESTATTFANVALAASKYMGGQIVCTVTSDDATDFQALTSTLQFQAVNKAGTVTATISQVDSTTAASAGTLTATYTSVVNGNGVDFKVSAVSSLTQTTLRVKWGITMLNTNDSGTVTPQ